MAARRERGGESGSGGSGRARGRNHRERRAVGVGRPRGARLGRRRGRLRSRRHRGGSRGVIARGAARCGSAPISAPRPFKPQTSTEAPASLRMDSRPYTASWRECRSSSISAVPVMASSPVSLRCFFASAASSVSCAFEALLEAADDMNCSRVAWTQPTNARRARDGPCGVREVVRAITARGPTEKAPLRGKFGSSGDATRFFTLRRAVRSLRRRAHSGARGGSHLGHARSSASPPRPHPCVARAERARTVGRGQP